MKKTFKFFACQFFSKRFYSVYRELVRDTHCQADQTVFDEQWYYAKQLYSAVIINYVKFGNMVMKLKRKKTFRFPISSLFGKGDFPAWRSVFKRVSVEIRRQVRLLWLGQGTCTGAFYQNAMHYSAYRGISIECDVKMRRNAAEFLGSILHHVNSFSMLWVRAAIGIKLDGTVMHYKL